MGGLADGRFKTIQDVLAAAKAKPETMTVAMNIGLLPHFVPLMFEQDAGVRFRYVQAGGGAVRLKSLLGKHTELSLFCGARVPAVPVAGHQAAGHVLRGALARIARCPDRQGDRRRHGVRGARHRVRAEGDAQGSPRRHRAALRAAMDDPELVERYKGLGIDRVFIEGDKLKKLLDGLKGPITKVGDLVRKAKAEQGEKKK